MVKRKQYSQDFKEKIVAEILAGAKIAHISQREGISVYTLGKWREKIGSGDFSDSRKTEIELRKRIRELEGALSETALENHIIKKSRQIMAEELRKERSLKRISAANLAR